LAIARARSCSGPPGANVQPHSGAQANFRRFSGLLQPGDTILGMDLFARGPSSPMARRWNVFRQWFKADPYGVFADTEAFIWILP